MYSLYPRWIVPATSDQPITHTHTENKQPIKGPAQSTVCKQSIPHCCSENRPFGQPSSNAFQLSFTCCLETGTQTGGQKLPGSLSCRQILASDELRTHCLIHLSRQNVTRSSSGANRGPSESWLCHPVTLKACESGRQKNKPTLCPAAHLGSDGVKTQSCWRKLPSLRLLSVIGENLAFVHVSHHPPPPPHCSTSYNS